MDRLGVALFGLGTVGTGGARLLVEQGDRLSRRSGRQFELKWVVVRDHARVRDVALPAGSLTQDVTRVLQDPAISVVVEAIGGTDFSLAIVLAALDAGKDVVT